MAEYRVFVEFDPETRHYTATVPGLPDIIVDAKTERTAIKMAREGIAFYRDEARRVARPGRRRTSHRLRAKVVTVTV